ncbi:hydroxymethylglutaryl-CoA lyase, partial [Xanthovirga aplysinae]|uniref:hydroxymethylglutaryl-CoA lyase n=1 Tax=Xanthovirga aplysinae TaxID=2529853 RepID=UPI0012BCED96
LPEFIPTQKKADYINQLLKVGFDTIDFGSFVSPKAIPQMKDTVDVLDRLDLSSTKSKLLAIVANKRGADHAVQFEEITYLGFPLSISETFQQRNTKLSIAEALITLQQIQDQCLRHNKILVTYISMGFGNPYGDPYNEEVVAEFVLKLKKMGVKIISLADTIGVSSRDNIMYLFSSLISDFPTIEFGAHLHSSPKTALEKISACYSAGCHRFDGAIKGFGGCPMAKDELVGNLATESLIAFLGSKKELGLKQDEFLKAMEMAEKVFS